MKTTIAAFMLLCTATGMAQNDTPATQKTATHQSWQQCFEQLSDFDDIEEGSLEDLYEQLCELEDNPIDLNSATDDDISRLAFLSNAQKEELSEYLDRYRPMRSLGELVMIQSIDPLRLQMLRNFVYIGNGDRQQQFPTIRDIAKYGKNELVGFAGIPFYTRKGDRNGYLGYKYKHWLRYSFKYGQHIQIGILGTQDAGEPFFSGSNGMGYDHYACYAIIRRLGIIKSLALGQYKIRFGQGLIINTGFSLGKTTAATMSQPNNTISPNSSRSDAYYLQGAAATISANRHIDITAFVSSRKIDATLDDDGNIRTLLKTGYHRTISEMQRKHNASQTAVGGNINWHNNGWHIGASGIYTSFSRDIRPVTTQAYRRYYPDGNGFYNTGIDYGYQNHCIQANGETAINNNGAVATLNNITVKANASLTLTAIQRYYSYRYYSLFSSAFNDGGRVQNENGIYIGATWNAIPRLTVTAYADYAHHPWPRYGVSKASHSCDYLTQAIYAISTQTSIMARYRMRIRQEDYNANDTKNLTNKNEHRMRMAFTHSGTTLTLKTQADAAYITYPTGLQGKPNSFGWMLSQTVSYSKGAISATANAGYFHTRDYNSRLYSYERSPLYTFSFPMFYGEGMRIALLARTNIGKNVVAIAKVGTTKYFDRNKISSSYQQIDGSSQTDLSLQVRWKF